MKGLGTWLAAAVIHPEAAVRPEVVGVLRQVLLPEAAVTVLPAVAAMARLAVLLPEAAVTVRLAVLLLVLRALLPGALVVGDLRPAVLLLATVRPARLHPVRRLVLHRVRMFRPALRPVADCLLVTFRLARLRVCLEAAVVTVLPAARLPAVVMVLPAVLRPAVVTVLPAALRLAVQGLEVVVSCPPCTELPTPAVAAGAAHPWAVAVPAALPEIGRRPTRSVSPGRRSHRTLWASRCRSRSLCSFRFFRAP